VGKYTALGKNQMLLALKGTNPTTPITHAALFDAAADITAVTGVTSTDTFTKTTHGLVNGDLVILTAMSGGSGLRAGNAGNGDENAEPLFVIGSTTNTFQLSRTPGGAAADLGTDVTAVTVTKLVELTGGSPAYARKAIAYNNPVDGSMDDSTNGAVFDVPAGATVDYVGYFSAVTAGTLDAIDKVTPETFGGQGTYTLTDSDLDLLAA
jgi:hypothetical protein